jgi:hypothetical protein
MRFTIRTIMIAVPAVAIPLALPNGLGIVVAALSLPCLCVIGSQWMINRGRRRLATTSFWAVAISSNVLCAGWCLTPDVYLLTLLFLVSIVIVVPAIASFGTAWLILSSRPGAVPRRSAEVSALVVFLLAFLPIVTVGIMWPLRIAFIATRPALERLADQVVAGQSVTFPQRVGPFRLVKAAVDPVSGNVALMTDSNPNGPKGFVRVRPADPPIYAGPIVGSNLDIVLGWGWWYRDED